MKINLCTKLVVLFAIMGGANALGAPSNAALPPIKTADYDQRGRFHINHQPFFPILLYGAPTDDQTLDELREFDFNVLACDLKVCASLRAKGFYCAVHGGKKIDSLSGVLFAIGVDSPALYFQKNLLQQLAEVNAKVTAAVPDRPLMNAIGYWEDEPAGVVAGRLPAKEKYDDLVAAIDVAAPYLYPVPYQPIASVGEAVARRAATGGKKPVLPILQLFAWKPNDRYPTSAELRCMAFLALVEGASGIGYYCYSPVTGQPKTTIAAAQPELWRSVKKLNHEIAAIGPQLVAGKAAHVISLDKGTPSVKMKAIQDSSGVQAVLVNSAATKQQAKLVWQNADTTATLALESGKQIEIKQGIATLSLEPFGVEFIRWLDTP